MGTQALLYECHANGFFAVDSRVNLKHQHEDAGCDESGGNGDSEHCRPSSRLIVVICRV
jgi:hypothetical protein